jgi:hypothetical protein
MPAALHFPQLVLTAPGRFPHFVFPTCALPLPLTLSSKVLLTLLVPPPLLLHLLMCRILKAALAGSSKQLQQEMTRDPAGQGGKILVTANGIAPASASLDACSSGLAK